jgi:hypothetical protein
MNLKAFFVASLQSALDLGIATPEDVLKHVTPDVLAQYLPRPLWARMFTACLGAPKVDAQLLVETIGVPNLCEHVPAQLIWACLAEIGQRSLGMAVDERPIVLRPKSVTTPPPAPMPSSKSGPLTAPPPDVITKPANPPLAPPPKVGPSIPSPGSQSLSDIVAELESEHDRGTTTPPPARGRVPTQQRFRQSQTGSGIGRLADKNNPAGAPTTKERRPQAATQPSLTVRGARRGETEVEEAELETNVQRGDDWRAALAVEEDQLVDWQSSEETLTVAEDLEPRKR